MNGHAANRGLLSFLLAIVVVCASCSGAARRDGSAQIPVSGSKVVSVPTSDASGTVTDSKAASSTANPGPSPLSELVRPGPSALLTDRRSASAPVAPVSLEIEALGVAGASVRPVGVEANGEMEIPGADEVGWYRFGPVPGGEGSAVLAAHVAYNGRDGVFRHLTSLEVGDRISVGLSDGSARSFEVVELARYAKEELPFDQVFARRGAPVLTLITCGGAFNSSLRSFADNVVAVAVPVG